MADYKLLYFNIKGKGQAIRLLLADHGIAFKEELILTAEDWQQNWKPKLPFRQVPVFYVNGDEIAQSCTILRYLAKQHGLYGSNDIEAATIDMLNDSIEDLYTKYFHLIYKDYDNFKDEYVNELLPGWTVNFENWLQNRADGGKSYLMGDKICYADYNLLQFLDAQLVLSPTCLDSSPLLKAYYGRVAARPKIAEFLSSDVNTKRPINGNGKQ